VTHFYNIVLFGTIGQALRKTAYKTDVLLIGQDTI